MKKSVFALLILAVCVLAFCGCDDTDTEVRRRTHNDRDGSVSSDTYSSEASKEQTEYWNETELATNCATDWDEVYTEITEIGTEENGPGAPPSHAKFEFSYELSRTKLMRGESVELVTTVKNVSGAPYTYVGSYGEFMAGAVLYTADIDTVYELLPEPIALTQEFREYTVADGGSRSVTYRFYIPEDAFIDYYDLKLYYGGEQKYFSNVIRVCDEYDVDVRNYTGVCISLGEQLIRPASGFVESSGYDSNTDTSYEACGAGAYSYFWKIKAWGSDTFIPAITKNEDQHLNVDIPNGISTPDSAIVIEVGEDFDNSDNYKRINFEDINGLPEGEYYVMIDIELEHSSSDGSYSSDLYEDFFKLTVVGSAE